MIFVPTMSVFSEKICWIIYLFAIYAAYLYQSVYVWMTVIVDNFLGEKIDSTEPKIDLKVSY